MPIVATDLIKHGAASIVEDDTTSPVGGVINATRRPVFTQWTASAVAAVVSDGADARTVTIKGRLVTGVIDTEVLTLNGLTEVVGAKVWERVLKITLSASDAARTVTVRQGAGGATRATIPPNELMAYSFYIDSASEASPVARYEKLFWKNNHATLTLNGAKITLTADPAARIKIQLAAALDDSVTVTNRKTSPGGTFSDDGVELTVPTGVLPAQSGCGVWVEQALLADDAPIKSTFTTRLAGTTV